ncbi:MAG: aminotransferase class III-fold pyridoxal phosphate-dependent enzyme, partial [Cyclobacteriaceae bacterium]
VLPEPGFLEGLREICDEEGIVLIFDEVMTGFRLSKGGAQGLLGVKPDMTTMGKIIGGGMPVGAYGGRREIMDYVSPEGPVYQAGTLSGNPIAMAAGLAILRHLNENSTVYAQLNEIGNTLTNGIKNSLEALNLPYTINHIGSMYSLFFTGKKVTDFNTAQSCDTVIFGKYFNAMLNRGIYLAPSQYESLFLSTALQEEHINRILEANLQSLKEITR